jgi:hypothetical protein
VEKEYGWEGTQKRSVLLWIILWRIKKKKENRTHPLDDWSVPDARP